MTQESDPARGPVPPGPADLPVDDLFGTVDTTGAIPVEHTTALPLGSYHPTGQVPGRDGPGPGHPLPVRPAPARRRHGAGTLAAALLLGLVGGGAAGYTVSTVSAERDADAPRVVEAVPAGTTEPTAVTAIAAHALPSVVFISVNGSAGEGMGSGFVVREDGYIVTNSHVIEGADEGQITVSFHEGENLEAEVVGSAPEYDIAVLQVDQDGLPALEFGDSDALQVGASVVAVGAPLGLDNTVTSGIVSSLNRPVIAGGGGSMSYINAIQTDAAINPGNSGGPLLDLNGHVIGVNSAIAQIPGDLGGGPAGSIGLGFAIPARQVEHTATQLIETGQSDYPVIGVLLDMSYTGEGAKVLEETDDDTPVVVEGGPADLAGVQPGEIIVSVDGELIEHGSHLIIILRSHAIGDEVTLVVQDTEGDERTVTMTLQGSQ